MNTGELKKSAMLKLWKIDMARSNDEEPTDADFEPVWEHHQKRGKAPGCHRLHFCDKQFDAVLTAISEAGCTIVPETYKAEMELLEEVCAIYTRDEDRYLTEDGEPYGLVPVDAGIKARSAAQRFYDREAMLSSSPFKREEG